MKKSILFLFMIIQLVGYSQVKNEKSTIALTEKVLKNEIKLNLGMIFLGLPEISYERILTNNQSVGVSAALSLKESTEEGIKYMISAQYRLYFGKQRANGFFMEFNSSVYEERVTEYNYWNYYYPSSKISNDTKFGIGMGAGCKFLTKSNLIGEVKLGFGRDLLHKIETSGNEIYPRLGFSIGKRF